MLKVYIAGPYTKPDPCANTHAAVLVADELVTRGYTPYIPHLSHFWHTMSPKPYAFWLAYDLEWMRKCDVVLRIPGESSGADKEIADAVSRGIPVVYSMEQLTQEFLSHA